MFVKRLLLSALFLMLGIGMVAAQEDDVRGDLDLFGVSLDVEGVIIQNAASGSFTALDDGSDLYTLRLQGVADADTDIVQVGNAAPLSYTTTALALDWSRAAGDSELPANLDDAPLIAEGDLTIEAATVFMTIAALELDADTGDLLYTVRVDQIIPSLTGQDVDLDNILALTDKAELPETFETATLTISGSTLFWNALALSTQERAAVIRSADDSGLAAQCAEVEALDADLSTEEQRILDAWYDANCR